jgi:hypothetical protein
MATAQEIVAKIAEVSTAVGWQSGTGGCELAGMIVSSLAARPELIDRFMTDGAGLMIDRELDWSKGCLTFHNTKGDITTPQELRMSCQVRDMKKAAGA